jgi:hypothetical protein
VIHYDYTLNTTMKRRQSIRVSNELLVDGGWTQRWPAWADRERTEWWLHLPEMVMEPPPPSFLASSEWLGGIGGRSMIFPVILPNLPIGPARELTRRQRLGVAWSWWAYRHRMLLWWLRPWVWDWKNWPWHSTAEYND